MVMEKHDLKPFERFLVGAGVHIYKPLKQFLRFRLHRTPG